MLRPATHLLFAISWSGAAVTVEAQRIFNAVGDREGEADALRMQVEPRMAMAAGGGVPGGVLMDW